MINKAWLLQLHDNLNRQFWGAPGIRDMAALEGALARPLASFGGTALYPTPLDKIAALTESMIKNHPFLEGNMRTAYVLMRLLLLERGLDLSATEEERHELMLDTATSRAGFEQIREWLQQHTTVL